MRSLILRILIFPIRILAKIILLLDQLPGPIATFSLAFFPLFLLFFISCLARVSENGLLLKVMVSIPLAICIMMIFASIAVVPLLIHRGGVFGVMPKNSESKGTFASRRNYREFLVKLTTNEVRS